MTSGDNVPELTVSELALSLKRTLEDTYARVRVRGELSRVKIHSSGHLYSDLKDSDAVLNIICWRGTLAKLSITPEEGLDVVCTGRITSYPARSNYQMVVEQMELAGQGALLKMLEDRKKRLAAEGLFDPARKKKLPYLPEKIGVVTSPTGAVIRDILHRLEDRFPRPVIVWPVRVQGEGAAEEIAAAIRGFNSMPDGQRPDLLIVARGGGSLEDLMPFNEETVVRAAAESHIPLISAVGHETDTTLIDFAADLRAPTPTAAAEMAVPERVQIVAMVDDCRGRLYQSLMRQVKNLGEMLRHIAARIGSPERVLELRAQRLDHLSSQLVNGLERHVQGAQQVFLKVGARLLSPSQMVMMAARNLEFASSRLQKNYVQHIRDKQAHLLSFEKLLEALSFKSVLGRGFALIRNEDGNPIQSRHEVRSGDVLQIEFKDGQIYSVAKE
jgi:exodeoxyribonuclease VII large subunit